MKKLIVMIAGILIGVVGIQAQTTTASATVVDSDSTVWANGTWSATYAYNPSLGQPVVAGQSFTTTLSGSLNGSGAFSQAVTSTGGINPVTTPPGSGWIFCATPAVSNPHTYCTAPMTVTGATFNASTAINAIIVAPRLTCGSPVNAYADVEISSPVAGCTYFNLVSLGNRTYSGTSWTSSAGSGTVTNTTGALTSGTVIIGNGGSDLKSSLCVIGSTGSLGCTAAVFNGGAAAPSDGLIVQLTSSNADQTGETISNSSSNLTYGLLVGGSNTSIPGLAILDTINGAVNWNLHATGANAAINAMASGAILGFASTADPTTAALDTGISRGAAGVVDIGTGAQGDASGSIHAATFVGSASAVGGVTITGTPSSGWVPTATGATTATWQAPTAAGTVTSVSVTTANGVSGTVATATTTPAITVSLGAITPSSVAATGAVSGTTVTSTVATGTAPLAVTSTTPVSNLTLAGVSQVVGAAATSALPLAGNTGSIGGAIAIGSCDTGTATVTRATTSMVAVADATTLGAPGFSATGAFQVSAQVTAVDTVTVSVCAILGASPTPTSSTYLVRVVK